MVNKIPIVLATDKNLVAQMYITMFSAIKNKKNDTYYDFYCLLQDKLTKQQKKCFDKLAKKRKNVEIHFIAMGNAFDYVVIKGGHFTTPTYYRLKMPELLPQYNKALYLDVDICVLGDLTELYETDLENNYVAGVKSPDYVLKNRAEYFKSIGLTNTDTYINAGVTLYNLELIRKDNKTPELLEVSKRPFRTVDQDVINLVFENRIKIIDFKYNVLTMCLEELDKDLDMTNKSYGLENYKDAIKTPLIIHYVGGDKPWNSKNIPLAKYWWKYARKSPLKFDNLKVAQRKFFTELSKYSDKRIVFWGASLFLEEFLNTNVKLKRIAGIIDKDETKQGKKLGKYYIYSPNDIRKLKPRAVAFSIKHHSNTIYSAIKQYLGQNHPEITLLPNFFNTEN